MSLVLGIDPGFVNCGWALVNFHRGLLVDKGVRTLVAGKERYHDVCGPALCLLGALHDEYGSHIAVVVIEVQCLSRSTQFVEAALCTAAEAFGYSVLHAHPVTIKSHFGLGCHGHKKNKKRALEYVRDTLRIPVWNDHEADSMLLALWGCTKL